MRITFVLPHAGLSGGIRVVAIYGAWLKARGHTVTVVSTPVPQMSTKERLGSFLHGRGWPPRRPNGPSHIDDMGLDHRRIDRYRPIRATDVPDADVLVATWWETAEWAAEYPASKGAKVYFIQHDETVFYPDEDTETRERVLATWRLQMRQVVVAQWLGDLATERGGGRATLVPNAVDHSLFCAPARGKQPRPTVGMMYSTVGFKGADIALKAFEIARRRRPELDMVCFGMDDPGPALPLPQGAAFTKAPPQARIPQLYASCDAWLFASRSEGFGLPILEAMACRTPVIGTPAGAAPELLADGAGIPVGHENPDEMAEAILKVVSMPDADWRSLSDAAWSRAARCSWDWSAALFEAELIAAAGRGGGHARPVRAMAGSSGS